MRMPREAPRPVPVMIAVGVARPSAHGHAMISTAMNEVMAYVSVGCGPKKSHARNVRVAMPNTTGTKTDATWSTGRWIGAFDACASATMRTICARTEEAQASKAPIQRLVDQV